ESRDWERRDLVGMEIYNIDSDFKRYRGGVVSCLADVLLGEREYPRHLLRTLLQRPTYLLQRWNELNLKSDITGMAGNDAHQNVGLRAIYTSSDTIQIDDTSPKAPRAVKLNWLTRGLARICFGPLTPGRQLFHLQLDPYDRSARFVNTHVLAEFPSEP